ncbi:hypothetical protein DPEC_G00023090 [Dallia pectoralis]|uniref:Uncharacterized protein n=1 Tax=Dallia pectoralis TaxID=75939 RepID=A0ACC2HI53_DALPE|nr:hypothetical protein DPEC_G00023090 [Dallia pectoralis]
MSSEQRNVNSKSGRLSHRPPQLALVSGPGYSNGNSDACIGVSSPDSLRSLSSLSGDGDSSSPADVDMECCPSDGSPPLVKCPPDHLRNVLIQTSKSCGVTTGLDIWNGNTTSVYPSSLQGNAGDHRSAWNGNRTSVYKEVASSPEEECLVSLPLSGENNHSVSSGEMVMRRNSFCMQEGDTLTVSLTLLELSTGSSAQASPALPGDFGQGQLSVSTMLPDVCDVFLENRPADNAAVWENSSPQHLGMTFIQSDNHDVLLEGDELALPRSPLDVEVSSESGGLHQGTFLCGPVLSASCEGASFPPSSKDSPDAVLWRCFSGGAPNDNTFVLPSSEELHTKSPTHTSTPVGCAGNKPLEFLSLTQSPCNERQIHPASPAAQTPKDKQRPSTMHSTSKPRLVARLTSVSANRIGKVEIKKFSKPDFSSVRPKIMSRPAHSLTMGSPALPRSVPQKQLVPRSSRTSQVDRNTQARNALSKLATQENGRSRSVVTDNAGPDLLSATFIQAGDQDFSHPVPPLSLIEEAGTSLSDFLTAAAKCVPFAPSSQAGSEAVRLPPEQPGNQTFFPSPSKSSSTELEADTTPAPGSTAKIDDSEEVLHKNGKSPGSAFPASSTSNQDKVPVLPRRSRCWSDSSSTTSTSTLHRENRASKSSSASFSNPKADIHLGQSQDRPTTHIKQPESRKEAAERNRKEIKKCSLVTASSKPAVGASSVAGAVCDGSKSRFETQPFQNRPRAATAPATQPRPPLATTAPATQPKPPLATTAPATQPRPPLATTAPATQPRPPLATTAPATQPKPPLASTAPATQPRPPPPATTAPATLQRPPPPATIAPATQVPASHLRQPLPAARLRQGRDVWSGASGGMGSPKAKRSTKLGCQNSCTTEGLPVGNLLANGSVRPPVSRPRQTYGLPLAVGSSHPAISSAASSTRLPYKPQNVPRGISLKSSEHSTGTTGNTQVLSGPAASKTTVFKARLFHQPERNSVPALTTGCKNTVSTNQVSSRSVAPLLKRSSSSRLIRPAAAPVDKNRPRAAPRSQPPQQPPVPPSSQCNGRSNLVPGGATENSRAQSEKKNQGLQQLQGLLRASNCRFEAILVVLQQTLTQRDKAIKQRRNLSQELITLQDQLVSSTQSCERLEREKNEVRGALEGVQQRMQEEHQMEMAQLKERLTGFYQAQWDQIHLTYQEQADKCKSLMEQQMAELTSNHEALKWELQDHHCRQIQCVKQQYEGSLEELRKAHEQELQTLDKQLKETDATLSGQIQALTEENAALIQKLRAEEERRRELAERDVKDSHTLYLEQELESLKVVMDIKNKQLHQQEHKLMQMDKLMEKSVKLDECLKKVQQENEDLKARMDRHAALSRQLSTEQAMLQESLHKESKVNKRLSMENEELVWKLHNGDLSSPRKVSPTSPTHNPLSLQSPRSSGVFTSSVQSPHSSAVYTSPVQSPRSSAVFTSPPLSPR